MTLRKYWVKEIEITSDESIQAQSAFCVKTVYLASDVDRLVEELQTNPYHEQRCKELEMANRTIQADLARVTAELAKAKQSGWREAGNLLWPYANHREYCPFERSTPDGDFCTCKLDEARTVLNQKSGATT